MDLLTICSKTRDRPNRVRRFSLSTRCFNGRDDRIRTCDILLPKQARYQTAPRPDSRKNRPCGRPSSGVERVTGIEPASGAWKAPVLPLNYTRTAEGIVSQLDTAVAETHK